jgi:hypothetical protein
MSAYWPLAANPATSLNGRVGPKADIRLALDTRNLHYGLRPKRCYPHGRSGLRCQQGLVRSAVTAEAGQLMQDIRQV